MHRLPIAPDKGIFSDGLAFKIIIEGLFIGILSLTAFHSDAPFILQNLYLTYSTAGNMQIQHFFHKKLLAHTNFFCNFSFINFDRTQWSLYKTFFSLYNKAVRQQKQALPVKRLPYFPGGALCVLNNCAI